MKKRVVPIWASVLMLVLCSLAITLNLIGTLKTNYELIQKLVYFLVPSASAIFAIGYCVMGYKKKPQLFYRLSIGAFGITELLRVITITNYQIIPDPIQIINDPRMLGHSIEAICLLIIALAKDLGAKKSKIISSVVFFVALIITIDVTISSGIGITIGIRLTNLILAIKCCIMVYAKYEEKANRNALI